MPTIAEGPHSVGADSVFKAVVKIPYKNDLKEIGADGSEVPLQVGAVVMLPDGFKLCLFFDLFCPSFLRSEFKAIRKHHNSTNL